MTEKGKEERIIEWLVDRIAKGHLASGSRIPSEYELAEMFQVNKTTANKAVGRLVARNLLKRGRGGAGTTVTSKSIVPRGSIGLLMDMGLVSYYSRLLQGIQRGAFLRGYTLVFFDCFFAASPDFLAYISECDVKGLIATHTDCRIGNESYPLLRLNDMPPLESGTSDYICHDNFLGGKLIAEHILSLGHRKIIYLIQNPLAKHLAARRSGFLTTLREAGIEPVDVCVYVDIQDPFAFEERLRNCYPEVTAVCCDGDNIAISILHALEKRGWSVPRDISVSGFSCLPEYQRLVRITSVDEKPLEFGNRAANLLADRIEQKITDPLNLSIPVELSPGETTAPPRKI